jgi:hypothetical protein
MTDGIPWRYAAVDILLPWSCFIHAIFQCLLCDTVSCKILSEIMVPYESADNVIVRHLDVVLVLVMGDGVSNKTTHLYVVCSKFSWEVEAE